MTLLLTEKSVLVSSAPGNEIAAENQATAESLRLNYVNDRMPGIERISRKNGFQYRLKGVVISDPKMLERIKKLVIPPAWTKVWICPKANGHLQVTGIDALGRKQYRYHPKWTAARSENKFSRLEGFGKALPKIRERLEKDLAQSGLCREKILAAVVSIMDKTSIRIGNSVYEKLYGSFGLSTLKNRHVNIRGTEVRFCFKGKKGVQHEVSFKSARLARIIMACKDLPGQELFQYPSEGGDLHSIGSADVNDYIREISGCEFTSKDFRTWIGSVEFLLALKEQATNTEKDSETAIINKATDCVAAVLGNTRAVCIKHYIYPELVTLFKDNKLQRRLTSIPASEGKGKKQEQAEKLLLKILSEQRKKSSSAAGTKF